MNAGKSFTSKNLKVPMSGDPRIPELFRLSVVIMEQVSAPDNERPKILKGA
jgi:hypothetical protein